MLKALKGNEKGLTLIELLAVLVIVGIIAAIAIPAIGGTITKSKVRADNATKKMLEEVTMRYIVDEELAGDRTVDITTLVSNGYLNDDVTWQSTDNSSLDAVQVDYNENNTANTPLWSFTVINKP